jgi:hypothetical protein
MEGKKSTFGVGDKRTRSKEYHRLETGRFKSKNPLIRARNFQLMKSMRSFDPMDPNFKRILYVRYADDFVILLICSLTEVYTLRRQIKDFLNNKLGLTLN